MHIICKNVKSTDTDCERYAALVALTNICNASLLALEPYTRLIAYRNKQFAIDNKLTGKNLKTVPNIIGNFRCHIHWYVCRQ